MKKVLYLSAAALALLGASCSQDDVNPVGNDGMTTLSISIPGAIQTRYGEAATTPSLYIAIYKKADNKLVFSNFPEQEVNASSITGADFGAADAENMRTANVSVPLVKGMTYDIVCWAQQEGTTDYTFSPEGKTITVTYGTDNTIANYGEQRDAFFGQELDFTSAGEGAKITLTRPFAQINVGTGDWAQYKVAGGAQTDQFGMTIEGVANTLDLTNGTVTAVDAPAKITVTPAAVQEYVENGANNFPAGEYTYLDMAYVLANQNLTVGLTGIAGYPEWTSVPAKMNYRTNIFGNLLTNQEDFTITLNPNWGGQDENYIVGTSVWDGKLTTPAIDEATKTITLNSASDFAGLANLISEENNYPGYTVKLNTDVDMKGLPMNTIAPVNRSSDNVTGSLFKGVFDGQNHTVSNVVVNGPGVFGGLSGADAAIKNLKFENLTITNTGDQTGVVSLVNEGATVSNVHVLSGNISGNSGVGAIVGRMIKSGTITGCTNAAAINSTSSNTGGIIGAAYYDAEGQTMTISKCSNTGKITTTNAVCGGIVGLSIANVTDCTNSGEVTGNGISIGGIIGEQQNYGTVSGCTNTADITNNAGTYGTGGIIGWLRYNGVTSAYPVKAIINVTGCKNSGNISAAPGSSGAGGIVGIVYNWANISNCNNTATSLSGGQYIAGIVGGMQSNETPPGMTIEEFGPYKAVLTGNTTTTTLDQMTGSCKALLVYVNTEGTVEFNGNTPEANN